MNINFDNGGYHFQLVPLYGFAIGYLYYHPSHEDIDIVDDDTEWSKHQVCLGIFAIIVTTWRDLD